jgi:hypothetical protein
MRIAAFAGSLALIAGVGAATIASAASPQVTTQPATSITSTDATLNGTNGDTDATASAFWVATSTFSAASSSSPTLPDGVYSTGALPAVASSTDFSAALSSATIPAGLLPITPGTTYYFTAWTEVGGVWYPGAVLSFTTASSAPVVSSISPTSGTTTGATSVTITGTGFTGASAVNFGPTPAASFTVNSDTSITALSPATTTAGVADVTVTTTGGTSATSSADQFTYVAPTTATPVISNVQSNVTGTSTATITWTTDIPSIGNVSYGTTTSYGSSSPMEVLATTTHSVNLSGLSEGTLYHYRVSAGTATSSDRTFVTSSTSATTPLAVTSVDAVTSSGIADNVFADGWKWVMHFTVPDNENAFRIRFSDWGNASSSFPANGNIRLSTAQSSNASTTASAITSTGNGYSDWIYLNGDTATSTAGRQIDLTVEVKIPFGTNPGQYSSTFTAQTYPSTATSTATQ